MNAGGWLADASQEHALVDFLSVNVDCLALFELC